MAEIRLSGVDKVYPGGTHAVHGVDLHIADGEFMIMVGPSGCAKSTILRMIAGLETPTGGTIEIGGRVVNDVAPKDRDIAMVFQSYALYPHMTVRENMAFGLRLRNMPAGEIDQRVAEAARILGLEHLLDRLPKAMSGGQRQRVAMGRAIVREPQAFLMDEPLSNLDAKLRVQMRTEIAKLHQRLRTTTVYVTHDQVEALTLGQRICILRKGVVQQVDTPFHVYQNPANVFVGGFIGSPGMNFVTGRLTVHGRELYVQVGEHLLPVPETVTSRLLVNDVEGRPVIVGIRPEHLEIAAPGSAGSLPVQVELVEAMGAEQYVYFTAPVVMPDLSALSDTQAMSSTYTARIDAGARIVNGAELALAPDMHEVHLFDPTSMLTLLAPADEAATQARRAMGLTTVSDSARVAAVPPSVVSSHASIPAVQPVGEASGVGMLPSDPDRVASVFDAPVAAPVTLEPMDAPPPPPHAPETSAPAEPARRGFAARPLGAQEPQETVQVTPESLDAAVATPAVEVDVVATETAASAAPDARTLPAMPLLERATGTDGPVHSSSAFRDALSRVRSTAPRPTSAPALVGTSRMSFTPPRIELDTSTPPDDVTPT